MKAIVLAGGGGKGAYELGVWKALRKLKIKYNIVTGTSIGALNGLLMAQNQYYKGLYLWNNIEFEHIYDDFDTNNVYASYMDKLLTGGIDTSKIAQIINSVYNPDKLYNSNIIYGVVSVNLTTREPVYSTTLNTERKKLPKYILASATVFPFFKPAKIDDQLYIDGGYHDNIPINLAIELGATDIIAVDLKAVGLRRKIEKDIDILYIRPNNKLESFLMFEKNKSKRMIKFGYNDTMKTFKKLDGRIYTFKKGVLNYNKEKYNTQFINNCIKYLNDDVFRINTVLESALEAFEIDASKIYKLNEANEILWTKFEKQETTDINNLDFKEIKKLFDKKTIIKNIYERLINNKNLEVYKLFRKEFLIAIYLFSIRR